ncbi:MAG: extracellular solute-binding protein, partial [Lactobacillus iners]|nr:extracellular solute-binding protein [Lactobacillus iners]
ANGIKDGYFQTAGSAGYLSGDFSNQKLAMYVGSSAGECFVKMGVGKKFEYGVAPRPSEYNIAQGTDIYMFDSASADQKAAAFMFIKFLLTKENQLAWADKTGYIPVTNTVISSEAYKESKKTKMPPILTKAMANLYSVPVVKNSNAAYAAVNTELQAVFAQAKKHKDWSENIKKGQHKIDSAWKQ